MAKNESAILSQMSPEEFKLRHAILQILRIEHEDTPLRKLESTAKIIGDFVMEYDRFRDEQIKAMRQEKLERAMVDPRFFAKEPSHE